MRHTSALLLVAALLVGWPGVTEAAEAPADSQEQCAPEEGPGVWLALRGGLSGYGGELASLTSVGPAYGLTLGFGLQRYVGLELDLDGSRNGLQGRGGSIVRSSVRALGKLFLGADPAFRAHLAAGAGLAYAFPTSAAEPSVDSDLFLEVPLAFGVEWQRESLIFGVRFGLTGMFGDSFAQRLAVDPPDGVLLDAAATIGYGF